ncbi:MAG: Signal peptidase I [Parcubacteria bacterium C7867-008]|nr:MAG: Signal peptidase I [Parcubacteria bacterium C7867-008]
MDQQNLLASAATSIEGLPTEVLASILVGILVAMLVLLAFGVLMAVSAWITYRKAGRPGWASLIPFYNQAVMLEFTNLPLWWIVLLFVPIVNIVVSIILMRRLAGVFGKGVGFTIGLIFLPFIFWPIIAFGRSTYSNTYPSARPMSDVTKWALIGLTACLLFQTAFTVKIDSFIDSLDEIAQESMESDTSYEGMDDESFGYCITDTTVCYDGEVIPGADPKTFKDLGNGYGVDANHVYDVGYVLEGADPATFVAVNDGGAYDAKDKDSYYYWGEVISEEEALGK